MNAHAIAEDLSALITNTLGKQETSIDTMLECIASRMGAFGCGLWEVNARNKNARGLAAGSLVTVASWWGSGELFAMDDVPLDDSPTARVAVTQCGAIVKNIRIDGGTKRDHPFFVRYEIEGMCASPVEFLDGRKGALNVYRRADAVPFSPADLESLEAMARIVPGLYRSIRERIGLRLIGAVEKILRVAEDGGPSGQKQNKLINKRTATNTLRKVCDELGEAFSCVETSLFLEDPDRTNGEFHCLATTNKRSVRRKMYHAVRDSCCFTGWVLANRRPLRVLDLAKLDRDASIMETDYPGLQRPHSERDIQTARKLLKIPADHDLPPLSLVAVPVFGVTDRLSNGADLRGVIRCYLAKSGPYYFSQREEALLAVVAAQLGQWWARWRSRTELDRENRSWNALVRQLGELNNFVRTELERPKPDESAILRKALRLTSAVIPGADLNGIRLHDRTTDELYFAEFSPEAELELKRLGKQKTQLHRFEIRPHSRYAGVRVLLTGKPHLTENVNDDKNYRPVFPHIKGMLMVPVGIGDERHGVLDLRWSDKAPPPYAEHVAVLLGQQLGIYKQLVRLVVNQREAIRQAERYKLDEASAYEDFAHQIRSPIAQAKLRAELGLGASINDDEARRWQVVRGLIRRAERVASSMRVLAELSHGRPITLRKQFVDRDVLVKKLIELADDTELNAAAKDIHFSVVRDSFTAMRCRQIHVDFAVLEQLVSNLLDNAAKYSRRYSVVRISCGTSRTERIYIAVTNTGLPFLPGEAERCKMRGWRSPKAALIATEGRGIGLWIVNELMKAHQGELQIISPNNLGETEIRLAFRPTHK